jgi:hypothetical protein
VGNNEELTNSFLFACGGLWEKIVKVILDYWLFVFLSFLVRIFFEDDKAERLGEIFIDLADIGDDFLLCGSKELIKFDCGFNKRG